MANFEGLVAIDYAIDITDGMCIPGGSQPTAISVRRQKNYTSFAVVQG